MATLNWGKGLLEYVLLENGAIPKDPKWKSIDTPKEDTLKLTATSGTEKVATEEGGGVVDVRKGKASYQLEFDLFVKKGVPRPFEDIDGQVAGDYAFRYTPEDDSLEGFLIERSMVNVEESYTAADGSLLHHVIRALKPASGKTVKPYTKAAGNASGGTENP